MYGFVKAAGSGENLIGTTIVVTGSTSFVASTNAYGFYSFTIPEGVYDVSCSHIGYAETSNRIQLQQGMRYNIEMMLKQNAPLDTLTITSSRNSIVRRNQMGLHRFSISDIKQTAMGGGEPDVLKSLQFLPGIQTSNEGTTNLSVRGGSYDQNLFLLDEAPVYNPAHTLGFISVFNTDALKDVSVYKGNFPAQYGGRLSAVVDVRMKEGNNKKMEYAGGIGFLAARLTVEGPIKKEKSSFIVSGRFGNPGMYINMAHQVNTIRVVANKNKILFYDINVKFNSVLGKKDRLYLSAYTGKDQFYMARIDRVNQTNWSNATLTVRWNHVFNAALFANTSLLYSRYDYSLHQVTDTRLSKWKASLCEYTLKTDFDWIIDSRNHLKFGAGLSFQEVEPGKVGPQNEGSVVKRVSIPRKNAAMFFAYFNNEQRITKRLALSYGIRATIFAPLGEAMLYSYNADRTKATDSSRYSKGQLIHAYAGIEPGITLRYLLGGTTSLKLSYRKTYQFQHLLSNSSVGLPTDIWLPAGPNAAPQHANQFAAGLYKTMPGGKIEMSAEVFFKQMENTIDFKDNATLFLNKQIETELLKGKAKAYGIEFMVKKDKGTLNGWISYTWSKALRKIDGVNGNEWYPPVYDHRHNLSVVVNQQLGKRLQLAANLVFRTGGVATMPEGSYYFNNARFLIYGKRNGYVLPDYHRMDISATWQQKKNAKRRWQGEWVLSIYNVYDRKNVFSFYVSPDKYDLTNVQASMVYIIGILPSITYNFKF